MKITKILAVLASGLTLFFASCGSSANIDGKDPDVAKGINAWNTREPEAARAYWAEIKDSGLQKKYLGYIDLFNAGNDAIESTDAIKATNEPKLLSACNTALTKFSAIGEPLLQLPASVAEKGGQVTAVRIDNLLAAGKVSDASKMYKTAVKVYGNTADLEKAGKEVSVCESIASKKSNLLAQASKAGEIETFDEKVAAYKAVLDKCAAAESEVNSLVKSSGVGDTNGVASFAKTFKKVRQDVAVQLEGAYRERVYAYKDQIGEEFARQPSGTGSGKNGAFTQEDILGHYESVQKNIDSIYAELMDFAAKHSANVSQDVLDDVEAQKKDLLAKIAQIK